MAAESDQEPDSQMKDCDDNLEPFLTGRQVTLRSDEAFKILKDIDLDECCHDMPLFPEGGSVYIFRPRSEQSKEDWRNDGYTWKNQGTSCLPKDKPRIRKRYFYAVNQEGNSNLEFRKDAYSRLEGEDENLLTLVHYLGHQGEANNKSSVAMETNQSDAGDVQLEEVELEESTGEDQDLATIQKALETVTESEDPTGAGPSGLGETDKLRDAMATMKAALTENKARGPVVEMFNELLQTVYSEKEKDDVEYRLVMADSKSGKKSFIGSDKVKDLISQPPEKGGEDEDAGGLDVAMTTDGPDEDHESDNERSVRISKVKPGETSSTKGKTSKQSLETPSGSGGQEEGSIEAAADLGSPTRSSGRPSRNVDSPNWREIFSVRKKGSSKGPEKTKAKSLAEEARRGSGQSSERDEEELKDTPEEQQQQAVSSAGRPAGTSSEAKVKNKPKTGQLNDSPAAALPTPLKRGRGRPPKSASQEKTGENTARGRGRPRLSLETANSSNTSSPKVVGKRKLDKTDDTEDTPAAKSMKTTPRGRGRPRLQVKKEPLTTEEEAEYIKSTLADKQTSPDTSPKVVQTPRGRGRPKKSVTEEEAKKAAQKETDAASPAVANEGNQTDLDGGDITADGSKDGSTETPKRGRGRPPGSANKKPATPAPVSKDTATAVKRKKTPRVSAGQRFVWEEVSDDNDEKPKDSSSVVTPNLGMSVDMSSGRRSSSRQSSKFECTVCQKRFLLEFLLEQHLKTHPRSVVLEKAVPSGYKVEGKGKKRKKSTGTVRKKAQESTEKKEMMETSADDGEGAEEEMEVEEHFSDDQDPDWLGEGSAGDETEVKASKKKVKVIKAESLEEAGSSEDVKENLKPKEPIVRRPRGRPRGRTNKKKEKVKVACQECGKEFDSEAVLSHHKIVHIEDVVKCPHCFQYFEDEAHVSDHVQHSHKDLDLEENPIDFTDLHISVAELEELDQELQREVVWGAVMAVKKEAEADTATRPSKAKCCICSEEFNLAFTLKKHQILKHDILGKGLKQFQCSLCKKSFKSELSLQIHKVIHYQDDSEDRVCDVCDIEFATKGELRNHRRDEHDIGYGTYHYFGFSSRRDGKIVCEICTSLFTTLEDYQRHRDVHLVYSYHCTDCGHGFHSQESYEKHVVSKCTENEPHMECGLCKLKFMHYDTRRKHIKTAHNTKRTEFTCHQCGLHLEDMASLRKHLQTHEAEKIFKCEFCDKCFLEKRNLISHRDLHRGSKDHKCDKCGRNYFTKKGLQRHMHAHYGIMKYECRFCGRKFIYSDDKARHERIHGAKGDGVQSKSFVCNVCGKAFLLQNRLTRHMQVHNEERIFQCEVCNKRFQTSSTLRTHRFLKHTDVLDLPPQKKLMCEICGYVTYQRPRLRRHMETHNAEKEFGCGECGKKFQTSSSLNSHKMMHKPREKTTSSELFPCSWGRRCRKVFAKKVSLKRHLMSHVWRLKKGRERCECAECQGETERPGGVSEFQGEVVLTEDGVSVLLQQNQEVEVDTEPGNQTAEQVILQQLRRDAGQTAVGESMPVIEEAEVKALGISNTQGAAADLKSVTEQPAEDEQASVVPVPIPGVPDEQAEDMAELENSSKTVGVNTEVEEEEEAVEERKNRGMFDCPKCHLQFATACQVVKHVTVHKSANYPTCEVCGKAYLEKRNLIEHMSVHSGERPFECETCGKRFRTKTSHRQHCFIHAKIKPYICNYCGHGFTQKGFFDEHLRRHTGERPFSCTVCNRGFVSKDLLRRHSYSHTGNKPHPCNLCGKSFIEHMQLVVHMRTHNDDRPFKCTKCEKAFFVNSKLQRHLMTVHKVDRKRVTDYVPTRISRGVGWRHKSKMKDFGTATNIVYVDSEGNIVSEVKGVSDIKEEVDFDTYEEVETEEETQTKMEADAALPPGPLEVRTRRDSSGNIQIVAKALPVETNGTTQATSTVLTSPGGGSATSKVENVIQVFKTSTGEYVQSPNYVQAAVEGGGHLEIITEALAAQGQLDNAGQGHIELITQEVANGNLQADSDGNIEIYTQADVSQIGGESENFSINISEDGTVDVSQFEKIEALRHLYQSSNSDQPIVIVLESEQQ